MSTLASFDINLLMSARFTYLNLHRIYLLNAGNMSLPEALSTPRATPTAPTRRKSSTGLETTPSPWVGDMGIPAQLEADSVSIAVVETCTNIMEALKRNKFDDLYEIIKNIMPDVTSDEDKEVFTDASAEVTMFVPPREDVAGVLHAFNVGDLTAEEVRFYALLCPCAFSHLFCSFSACDPTLPYYHFMVLSRCC
jgi:hypothetical protein